MIPPNRVRLKTPEWLDRKSGDLIMVDYLHETGIILDDPWVGDDGHAYVNVILTDTPGMVCRQLVQRTHLLSRPIGSVPQELPFPDELLQDEGPQDTKNSSERFAELVPPTIDEEGH
jgi:hypothetical protein